MNMSNSKLNHKSGLKITPIPFKPLFMPKNTLSSQAENNTANQETQQEKAMSSTKILLSALMLSISMGASDALAKPNMTDEQLAKAREVASKLNPPIDFDAMILEAEKLGIDCSDKDLTKRPFIRACMNRIESAKLDEEIKASQARQAILDENIRATEERLREKVNALADSAEHKLNQ